MSPDTINTREKKFADNLTDSSGKKFTAGTPIDIGDGFSITPLTAPFKTYYYQTKTEKTKICLHFTVGVITGDIASLTKENNHMSVPYVVDRLGNIYRLFDDSYWSYHLGSAAIGGNQIMSKASIGIEISNYGPLKLKDDKFMDAYGNSYCSDIGYVDSVSYRGYSFYAKMTEKQVDAVAHLIAYLSEKHGIPITFKDYIGEVFETPEEAVAYKGVFCHSNVRTDKFDLPPEITLQIMDALKRMTDPKEEPVHEEPVEEPEEPEPVKEEQIEPVADEPDTDEEPSSEPAEEQEPKGFWERLLDLFKGMFGKK